MSNDRFGFTPTGDFITVNQGDGVINAAQLQYPGRTIDIVAASKRYDFTPQDDITPLEAVWVAHFLAWRSYAPEHPQWALISRHFTEVK